MTGLALQTRGEACDLYREDKTLHIGLSAAGDLLISTKRDSTFVASSALVSLKMASIELAYSSPLL